MRNPDGLAVGERGQAENERQRLRREVALWLRPGTRPAGARARAKADRDGPAAA
jgi:hypothetical protein